MRKNIILIGFMGSGKSSVGTRLAKHLSYQFCDTDQVIEENEGTTINSIFAAHGEDYFRDIETKTIMTLRNQLSYFVISTGGGLPNRDENAKILKEMGFVVYLKASRETIMNRVSGDLKRPLLKGDNVEEKVTELLSLRHAKYEAASHIGIQTDNKSFGTIINSIQRMYEKYKTGELDFE